MTIRVHSEKLAVAVVVVGNVLAGAWSLPYILAPAGSTIADRAITFSFYGVALMLWACGSVSACYTSRRIVWKISMVMANLSPIITYLMLYNLYRYIHPLRYE